MTEFAAQVETRLKRLPQKTAKPNLVARAATLRQSIAAKSAPATVEEQSRGLAEALLGSSPVPLAPRSAPDLARGAPLDAETCSMCHGAPGAGTGPAAAGLAPPPIPFTDYACARARRLSAP